MSTTTRAAGWRSSLLAAFGLLLGTSIACVGPAAAADSPPLILEHLTPSDGLPQGTVFVTLQDSQGFVWLGTQDGLVRYDGHELLRYAYSPGAHNGLPGNYIHQIIEDAHHDLWIAIKDAGVARWNRATDTFTVYRHDPADAGSLSSDATRALVLDTRGRLWIGTLDAGIDILDPASGHFEHLRHDPAAAGSLGSDRIQTLALDRSGTLWVGTDHGLDRWDPERHSFAHFRHEAAGHAAGGSASLTGNLISQVLEDRSGALWIGTFDGGLDRMDREGRLVQSFRHDAHRSSSLADDEVHALLEDQAGHLWVGTSAGLDLLDRSTGQFNHYKQDATDPASLRDSFIMSLYEDQTGLMWIGTYEGGVSRWNPRSWELGIHRPEWVRDKQVTSFADASDNKVWIGTLGGGLTLFDADSGTATAIDALTGRSNAIGDMRVMALHQDHRGTLWIGTMGGGVKKLTARGEIQSIPVRPGDPHSLSAEGIATIFETSTGQLWVGTHGGGVNVLDPMTGLIRQLPFGPSMPGAVSSANITSIAEDRGGHFWIGTDGGGLDLARADGTVVRVFRHDADNPASLPVNTVYAVTVDAEDRVWVGTDGGGLVRVSGSGAAPDSIRFETISRAEGLSSDTVYGVLADASGRIWLSGNAGLTRYDPRTRTVKTYHREHGLQGEEFDSGASFRLRDGRLCFGGPGGFNIFDPSRLTESSKPPRLALTGVEIMGVPARSSTPYWLMDRVALDYRANILSLDFGTLDFSSPGRNRLAYRMLGLTDRWIDLGTQHRITLTNLESGDHVLEVRAANADSVWSQVPLRLMLHRAPAPWKSPWAYTVYALLIVGLIAYRARLQRVRYQRVVHEQQRLETEVALRTRELVDTNRQLEEAAQAKSNFLDRMSHELRTPMNGVVGMTELLARTALSSTQARLTQTIRSSAQVLLQIVNDLLDLSKINAGKVALEELPIEVGRICEECTSLFAGAAESKGIGLIVCPPESEPRNLLGDPLRVRQVLMNLVGNAVKFTSQGEIVVRADIGASDGQSLTVQFSIADTGIGMDAATIGRIFTPFTQADESTTRRFGGSGLGLAICRELADLMGGTITVESRPQVGSTFHFSLPLKIGAEQPRRQFPPLPRKRVRIVTRRPALGEALTRHCAALGLVLDQGVGPIDRLAGIRNAAEVVIVDAGDGREYEQLRGPQNAALIVVASNSEVEAQQLERRVGGEAIVLKPLRRDALYEAMAATLGVAPASADAAAILAADTSPIGGHVLLVEDEPVNAAVAQGYLDTLGCTSVWVKDGPEAIARHAAERFDLILMDLSMPTMDGFATTALIRQRTGDGPRVPIIALTAHDAMNYRNTCLQAGMDDMLSKPCTLEECARVLRKWIPAAAQKVDVAHVPARPDAPAAAVRAAAAAHITPKGAPADAPSEVTPPAATVDAPAAGRADGLARLVAASCVDSSAVARLRGLRGGGQPDLYAKLVDLFHRGSSESLAQLQSAIQRKDLQAAAALCHKLASSAANVGALAYAKEVRQLEQLCVAGDADAVQPLFDLLRTAHPRLIEELLQLKLRATA
ncbi:MAG TPA: two-component regulator propeller domain-containing protein [Steroidobacteraceae bacterium]|nr:two-component regulator propeller domain-containing protein [Steroidobacteraceae bacterium]